MQRKLFSIEFTNKADVFHTQILDQLSFEFPFDKKIANFFCLIHFVNKFYLRYMKIQFF